MLNTTGIILFHVYLINKVKVVLVVIVLKCKYNCNILLKVNIMYIIHSRFLVLHTLYNVQYYRKGLNI